MGLKAGKEARLGRTSHFCGPDCKKASKATRHQRAFKAIGLTPPLISGLEEVSHLPKESKTQ